ncbi:hypothetical protein GCM10010399_48970 [Dactylosporangium fulvum]|uniref:Uncharacterized protein n=1 Tax=Dactylosporangium fulvum TaxID=53359 RepID=A0ABY5VXS0_9ACTN|nr:hypothetical protein [Dactylosporangium fulvum]UWP81921.1 hypothetical protein Dfulv_43715 [Dactylosporangium fulvum]
MTESAAPSSLEIDYYLERVAAALADLPPEVRDDLLEDLPAHFAEVLEEQGGTLVDRLGPPAAYAAELRAAAGLETSATTRPSLPGRLDGIVRQVRTGAGVADRKVGQLIGYPRAADFLRLLRPAWWVARAVFIVVLIFAADIIPADRFDDPLGWLVLAVAVVVSVRIGATGRPRAPKWLGFAVTAVAVVGALFVVSNSDGILYRFTDTFRYQSNEPYDRWSHVTDVFPVDENGRPLQNVTLYDQDGNPIMLGEYWRCQNDRYDGIDPRPAPSYPLCKGPRLATPAPTATESPSTSPSASASTSPSASASSTP